jgi:Glyoxalase-like domain
VRGPGLRSARSRRGRQPRDRAARRVRRPQPTIILSRRDEPEQGKPRLHVDVNATDRDQDAELERLLKLGARPADIGQTGEEPWHVLADPEGNEFCLLKARLNPL